MQKLRWLCLLPALMAGLGAWGAPPRYIESLRVGGGSGDPADGGADLDANGDILTDGEIACGGGILSLGGASATHTLHSDYEGTAASSFDIRHEGAAGANAFLRLTPVVPDAQGSQIVELLRTYQAANFHDVRIYGDPTTITHYFDGKTGKVWHLGDLEARGGDVDVGRDGSVRGVLTVWDGGSASPGCVLMYPVDGQGRYLFSSQRGHLRMADALPTTDTAGWPVAARTLTLPAQDGRPCVTSGCAEPARRAIAASGINVQYLAFDGSVDEFAFWTAVLPEDYRGDALSVSVTWTAESGTVGDTVDWNVEAQVLGDGTDLAGATSWGTAAAVPDAVQGVDYLHTAQAGSDIAPAGTPQAGDILMVRVYRDADDAVDDTFNGDAQLLAISVRY